MNKNTVTLLGFALIAGAMYYVLKPAPQQTQQPQIIYQQAPTKSSTNWTGMIQPLASAATSIASLF